MEIGAFDLATLMQSAQAIAHETRLGPLLAKAISLLMEHTGAQRGCLLLVAGDKLRIAVEGTVEANRIVVSHPDHSTHESLANNLPWAIVHPVTQTQESLVLNHAGQDHRFCQDPYLAQHQPPSILCMPLMVQKELIGSLYLENQLTPSAFTSDRLESVRFLAMQAAISLHQAQHYHQLEMRVQQHNRDLIQANQQLQAEVIERQRSEQILRMIVAGTASVIGTDFFRCLVRSLAQALGVRYAFISECMDAVPTRVRSFAFWQGNGFGDAFEYDLEGTPCERVITSKGYQCFPEQIQTLFPKEKDDLTAMQAQSYAGVALLNSAGNLLGHLAVLDNKPMTEQPRNQAVLEIFAARAATEMERKQAEDALRVSETKFATAFRASPDAITISTLKDGCYIEVNDSCLRMLGYTKATMIGHSAIELGVWADPADRQTTTALLHQQGSITNLETKLRRQSGEIFPVLFSAEVIHLENEPCLLAVVTDITMLKQAEKALARLAEIGELAAMIVHEVRNPLTTIVMGLNAFKKAQLSERFQTYLALSLDEADRLQRLLNQILLYSRQQTLQRSPLVLNHLIAETLETLRHIPAAIGKDLQLIAPVELVTVSADHDKLKQVLINLITNACEAVNGAAVITVQLNQTENHPVCIAIHNGGDPIPPDVLPNLTKPFFTTKASGTGLGLAIVKRIIEAHDGTFEIASTAATGTIVKVYLPELQGEFTLPNFLPVANRAASGEAVP